MKHRLLLPLVLAACAPAATDTTPLASDTGPNDADIGDAEDACSARPVALTPHDGDEVGPDTPVEATFTEPRAGQLLVDGVAVAPRWSDDGLVARWVGLPEGARVRLSAVACGARLDADVDTTWRPVHLPHAVAWSLRLRELAWATPMAAPALLRALDVDLVHVRLTPSEYGVVLEGGIGDDCALTRVGTLSLDDNPRFHLTVDHGVEDLIHQLQVTGRLTAEGGMADLEASAVLDTRALGIDGWCETARAFGDSCVTCPDGADACLIAIASLDALDPGPPPSCED